MSGDPEGAVGQSVSSKSGRTTFYSRQFHSPYYVLPLFENDNPVVSHLKSNKFLKNLIGSKNCLRT